MLKSSLLALALSLTVAQGEAIKHPQPQPWVFNGIKGKFDKDKLQRGFQVFKEVCAVCHSIKLIRFNDLMALGFSEAEIKALAGSYQVATLNAEGQPAERPALPSDKIPAPYPNDLAARAANNGSLPPDLSLMTKARHHGPDYIYALLTGYEKAPDDVKVTEGKHYNPYFIAGGQIGMTPPLTKDGQVTYSDGTVATIDQMASDVVSFLSWVAEPELEERHRYGFGVLAYLMIMTILFYAVMRRIWKGIKG